MKRPTIADIAQRAGVTKAAVSFALNGQPGVSAATRERILAIAQEIGFQPNSAARALTAGKAEAFGLVIDRPARTLGIEPFFMQLVSGIQAELSAHQRHAAVHHGRGRRTPRSRCTASGGRSAGWTACSWSTCRSTTGGSRVLEELRMPAVVIGTPLGSGTLPAVWQDDRAGVETVVRHLAGLGHRRIARVGGFARYWHSVLRSRGVRRGRRDGRAWTPLSVEADYSAEHGAQATGGLLGSAEPPTAILYDNDVMAAAGLGVAQRMGFTCPAGCRSSPGTTPRCAS